MNPTPHPTLEECFLDHPYELAGRIVDPITGDVSWQGKQVHLQRKDLEVLALLASHTGSIISRASFIAVVWDGNDLVGDRGVSDKIFSLRRALADADEQQPIIRTIPRRGYQLMIEPVQRVVRAQPAFAPGGMIPGCPGWRLQRPLSQTAETESWLAHAEASSEISTARVFSFCRSEAQLRRFRRETTLLRYVSEALGARPDIVLIRDWQLQEPPYFVARDYCTHASLDSWAASKGGLASVSQTAREALMLALAKAVAVVHDIGLVHGQIGQQSIYFDDFNDSNDSDAEVPPQLKLSAFDLGALSDRNLLAPLKITAVGLSFIDGAHAPDQGDDITALGTLLLQLALADLAVEPTETCIQRVTDANLRALIAACFGPALHQPNATAVVRGLSRSVLTALEHGSEISAEVVEVAHAEAMPSVSPTPAKAKIFDQQIGPYRVFEKLGQGGMGVVYLAESREPVQRQVALKVILAGMDTAEVLARFEAERQALALMNHVNIAGVYDAGAAQSGRPYFAMEYVPGLEITAHCDERALDFRQRIELFLQVCDGVLHAHQKGIIHRDLKPSNILIKTAQGQPATAKIIDFGVAKSLQRKLGRLTAHTQLGSFVGTRTYSSPEQISGNIVALDTRTDTYSLGVVLYELLAGVTPYDEEVLAAKSPVELSKLISQEEPPPLLKRFISLDAQIEADIATRRKLTVAQMKQTLSSDLAWIVAKCLERDPNARYASVLELKKDLGRWLENRPVEARSVTLRYRIAKMVRRNWAPVALGSIVATVFLLTGAAAILGYFRAERALAEAELVADFQVKQIQAIDPAIMGNQLRKILTAELNIDPAAENDMVTSRVAGLNMTDVTLKQLDAMYFEPTFAAIENDFKDSPSLQARLMQSLGETLLEVGRYEKAKEVFEVVLSRRIKLFGAQHEFALVTLRSRGAANEGLGLTPDAEADYRTALAGMQEQLGLRHRQTIQSLNALGKFLLSEWRDQEADVVLIDAVSASRIAFGDLDGRTLLAVNLSSVAAARLGRLDEAEKSAREALAGLVEIHGKVHEESLLALEVLADVVEERGNGDLAETYSREVLQGATQLFGSKHQFTLASRHNLALTIAQNGRLAESIALHREVQHDLQEVFGATHPGTLASKIKLGAALLESQQLPEARQLLESAIALLRSNGNKSGALIFKAIYHLGLLAQAQGNFDEAERLLNESLIGYRKVSGDNHLHTRASIEALEALQAERNAQSAK